MDVLNMHIPSLQNCVITQSFPIGPVVECRLQTGGFAVIPLGKPKGSTTMQKHALRITNASISKINYFKESLSILSGLHFISVTLHNLTQVQHS